VLGATATARTGSDGPGSGATDGWSAALGLAGCAGGNGGGNAGSGAAGGCSACTLGSACASGASGFQRLRPK